jgi:hypothetical protein
MVWYVLVVWKRDAERLARDIYHPFAGVDAKIDSTPLSTTARDGATQPPNLSDNAPAPTTTQPTTTTRLAKRTDLQTRSLFDKPESKITNLTKAFRLFATPLNI